jgi:hypothetical protein
VNLLRGLKAFVIEERFALYFLAFSQFAIKQNLK